MVHQRCRRPPPIEADPMSTADAGIAAGATSAVAESAPAAPVVEDSAAKPPPQRPMHKRPPPGEPVNAAAAKQVRWSKPMEIIVRRPIVRDGSYLSTMIGLAVKATDTIDGIRAMLADQEGFLLEQCRLYLQAAQIAEGIRPLTYYSIGSGDTLHLRVEFAITIEPISGDTFTMEVDGCDQIRIVKLMIGSRTKYPFEGMQLIFGDKCMANGRFISDYELQAGSRVQLLMMT